MSNTKRYQVGNEIIVSIESSLCHMDSRELQAEGGAGCMKPYQYRAGGCWDCPLKDECPVSEE